MMRTIQVLMVGMVMMGHYCAVVDAHPYGTYHPTDCPSGSRVVRAFDTCGECPMNMYSRHYCGWWNFLGIYCFDDCYTCWECRYESQSDPEPTPETNPPTTSKPTGAPSFRPTTAPTISLTAIVQTLDRLEDCISRNLLFREMNATWFTEDFRVRAGADMEDHYDELGLRYDHKEECLDEDGKFAPVFNYTLDWVDVSPDTHHEKTCLAFGIYYYLRHYYLPSLTVATSNELSQLHWRNITSLCPLATVAFWEYMGNETRIENQVSIIENGDVGAIAAEMYKKMERISVENFETLDGTMGVVDPTFDPIQSINRGLVGFSLPNAFFEAFFIEPSQNQISSSYSQASSISIMDEFAQRLEVYNSSTSSITCENECDANEETQVFSWTVRQYLENGKLFAGANSAKCICIGKLQAISYCPPHFAKYPKQQRSGICMVGTFYDPLVDKFFSNEPTESPTPSPIDRGAVDGANNPSNSEKSTSGSFSQNTGAIIAIIVVCLILGLIIFAVVGKRVRQNKHVPWNDSTRKRQEMVFVRNSDNVYQNADQQQGVTLTVT